MSSTEDEVKRILAARYLRQAIGAGPRIPWQVAARLSETGLFDFSASSVEEARGLIELLRNDDSLDGQAPQLFLRTPAAHAGEAPQIYETVALLGIGDVELASILAPRIRRSVCAHATSSDAILLANEYDKLSKAQKFGDTIRAAAELDDALSMDWGWQLATLAEAWTSKYSDIIERQLSRLLHFDPSYAPALRFLEEQFEGVLVGLAEGQPDILELPQAREQLQKLGPIVGHLPWTRCAGFPSVLARVHDDVLPSLWETISAWSLENRPAWWFHVWFTAMCYPTIVPASAWAQLWARISILTSSNDKPYNQQSTEEKIWVLYSKLLKFYVYRIEAAVPLARSDFVMWCASKLASDIVGIVGFSYDEAVDALIEQALDEADRIWQIASPSIVDTPLRTVFLECRSWWPPAVQTSVLHWKDSPAAKEIPIGSREALQRLAQRLSARLFVGVNTGPMQETAPLLDGLAVLRSEWADILGASGVAEWIRTNVAWTAKFDTPDSITLWISKPLTEDGEVEGLIALRKWSDLIRTGKVSLESALEDLNSEAWKSKVEPSLPIHALERIVFGILAAPWVGRDTLRVEIPHWAAKQCLAVLCDEDRRKFYCIAATLLSIKGGTSSAVVRLRSEETGNELREDLSQVSDVLKGMLNRAPPWLCGRIRSVLAVLQE